MSKTLHRIYILTFFIAGIGIGIFAAADGLSYYRTSLEERFFHPDHSDLKPSGAWGHGYGIAGSLMMIAGVGVYMARKRYRRFFNLGYLKHWLEFHIFLCTAGPLLILYHTAFKFGGIVAVSFWSMVAVVLSGFAGRFIYVQIPRTIQGKEMDVKELEEESSKITSEFESGYSVNESMLKRIIDYSSDTRYQSISFGNGLLFVLQDYFRLRNLLRHFRNELRTAGMPSGKRRVAVLLMKQKLILSRRIGLLHTMQRIFKLWHIVHLPFAITMFVIMFIHIIVTIIFGYRWIF